MKITKRKDYPVSTGFPSSLIKLGINNCNLIRFDKRITRLSSLKILDLGDNGIEKIPVDFNKDFSLQELHMPRNKLLDFPEVLCKVNFCASLVLLDLSHNQVRNDVIY